MRRVDFEHVIAAAANVTGEDEFVVIGSQAILGSHLEPPEDMLASLEADIYPRHRPERADYIDGALGDGSPFHRTHGYYAHGVGPETARAPTGWQDRLVRAEIPPRVTSARSPVAWCLEIHDLVLSKCAAGRERDWDYAAAALKAGLVDVEVLVARSADLPLEAECRAAIAGNLRAAAARASRSAAEQ
jgi:hypothetical protein